MSITLGIDLHMCMTCKVVKQLNQIGAMKTFTKLDCSLYMEEHLTILKKLRNSCVLLMNKNSKIRCLLAQDDFPSSLPKH